ncbi:1-acyl-sn-glycerol-3-phosphate acyltransferase [Pedobacter sp. CAN_A7]|uniref:lysophospholipid acyltransferase family protein n=1 Tax=Pedobacter sp. CAN_A7 TaxID=2787722 RepID=UPI0018CAF4A2
MKKLVGYVLTPIFYFFFLLTLIIFQPIQWLSYKFGYAAHKKSVDALNFFLTYCQVFLGNSITFINEQELPENRPIIFIANHQSMYDIPGIIWFMRKYHVKFISKIELTKGIPSISFNLKYGGGANIDRKDSKQAIGEIIKLGRKMQAHNWSAMIFAEGTRAKDGNMKRFQVGGVATLLKLNPNALVVPIAIENSWKVVRYGMYPLSAGESLKWTVLSPVATEGQSLEEITMAAEKAIRHKLLQPLPA